MSVWKPSPIEQTPAIDVGAWKVYEAEFEDGTKQRHIVGYNLTEQEGRVSSAIIDFDPETYTCTTCKGRKYRLVKNYHCDPNNDAAYVWDFWQRFNKVVNAVDVTREYHK
jgi:hypothetical protein